MKRSLAVLAAIVLAGAGCGRAENSLLLLDDLPDIASISVEGNTRFDDGTLKGLMILKEGKWYRPFRDTKFRGAQLESDIRAILTYYRRNGYLKADIVNRQVRDDGKKVHIVLTLDEGLPTTVSEVAIHGARELNPNDLRGKLETRPGRPLDPFRLEDDRRLILQNLANLGHWAARVTANVQFFGQEAVVFYLLEEGGPVTVRDVEVEGMVKVRRALAEREIQVDPGEILRLRDLTQSQLGLIESGYFSDAQWDTVGLDTTRHEVSARFVVRERRLQWVEGGVGLSSDGSVRFGLQWGSRNFLNSGMRFVVNTTTDLDLGDKLPETLDLHRTEVIFNLRRLFGTRWEGQPSGFYLRDNEFIQDIQAGYSQDILGVGFSTRRRLGSFRNQIVLSLDNRWVFNEADSAAKANDLQLYRDDYVTRTLTVLFERDSRNDFFYPFRGLYQNAIFQLAGGALGGNNSFWKGTVNVSAYHRAPVLTRWVLAGRLQGGFIEPRSEVAEVGGRPITSSVEFIPAEDRYVTGGANSVRGYRQDELSGAVSPEDPVGGVLLLLGNVEARIPLAARFSLVTFLDAGNVWQDGSQLSWDRLVPRSDQEGVDPRDLRYTYGLGLRFQTPVGPVRLDYARKWNLPADSHLAWDRWHVSLGHAF